MRMILTFAALMVLASPVAAAEPPVMIDGKAWVYDPLEAVDIMRTCAPCHGETGTGGGGGFYPRLAGLNSDYLAEQLRKFKSRERENIPMLPYATQRELPERDVLTITRFLSEIRVMTKPPEDLPTNGLDRLKIMKKVLRIPREPGDSVAGQRLYDADCAACHGRQGEGRLRKPLLVGQHVGYLRTQIDNFLAGKRPHDDVDKIMRPRSVEDWANLWAYVTVMQDGAVATAKPRGAVDYDLGQ